MTTPAAAVPDISRATALTLQAPWGSAFATLDKRIENRLWETYRRGWLLIHQGKAWDSAGLPTIARTFGVDSATIAGEHATHTNGMVVAVAELVGICVEALRGQACWCGPWAMSQSYHWQFGTVHTLVDPVRATGRQQLWHPTPEVRAEVQDSLRDSIRGVTLTCGGRARAKTMAEPLPGRAGQPCAAVYQGRPGQARVMVLRDARLLGWCIGDTAMCRNCGAPAGGGR